MTENIETSTTEYLEQLVYLEQFVEEIESTIDELHAKKREIQNEIDSR